MDHDLIDNWIGVDHLLHTDFWRFRQQLEELCEEPLELLVVIHISQVVRLVGEQDFELRVEHQSSERDCQVPALIVLSLHFEAHTEELEVEDPDVGLAVVEELFDYSVVAD